MSILSISWLCLIAVVLILAVPNSAVAKGRSIQPVITLKFKQEEYWKTYLTRSPMLKLVQVNKSSLCQTASFDDSCREPKIQKLMKYQLQKCKNPQDVPRKSTSLYPGERARALHDLGYSHMSKGAYALAEPSLKQALGLTEKYLGASTDTFYPCERTWQVVDDYFLVDYLHTLATNYYLWGKFDLAEPYYRRLMKIMETYKLPGKDVRCAKIHDFRLAGDIRRYASILRSHNLNKEAEEVEAFASKFEQQQKDGLTPL